MAEKVATETGPMNIATISAGFEKGDFLVREEQGNRVYFDFFEEAFNYISNKGYSRMSREDEKHWVDLMNVIHDSVKGGELIQSMHGWLDDVRMFAPLRCTIVCAFNSLVCVHATHIVGCSFVVAATIADTVAISVAAPLIHRHEVQHWNLANGLVSTRI
jgi:hypothetical protein